MRRNRCAQLLTTLVGTAALASCAADKRTADATPGTAPQSSVATRDQRVHGEMTVGPEVPLDPPSGQVLPPLDQTLPSLVATGATGASFFAAWYDARVAGITGARIDGTTFLPIASDTTGVALIEGSQAPGAVVTDAPPALAANGAGTVLLAWTEEHTDKSTFAYAARFDVASGQVLASDASGIELGPIADASTPVAGWDGAEFVVGWTGPTVAGTTPFVTARIAASGAGLNPADAGGALLVTTTAPFPDLFVGCDGTACLFAFENESDGITTVLFPAGGPTSGATAVALPSLPYVNGILGVASDGARFAVAVSTSRIVTIGGRPSVENGIGVALVGLNGAYQQEIAITDEAIGRSAFVGFFYDGVKYVAPDAYGFELIDSTSFAGTYVSATPDTLGAVATANGSVLAIGQSLERNAFGPGGETQVIVGTAYDPTSFAKESATPAAVVESIGAVSERSPVLVTAPGVSPALPPTLFAFRASTTVDGALYGSRLDPASGAAIASDTDGAELTSVTTAAGQPIGVPLLAGATDGTNELLVWVANGSRGVASALYSPTTDSLSAYGQRDLSYDALADVQMAYGAGTYALAASDGSRISVTTFDAATGNNLASVIVSDGTLTSTTTDRGAASIAFDGTRFLVVWADGRSGRDAIYGAHVTTAGARVEANGFPISSGVFRQTDPSIAVSPKGALVVWSDTRNEEIYGDIYGRLLDPTGAPQGSELPIAMAALDQTEPVVTYAGDGLNYQVAWRDARTDPSGDIFGGLVGLDGTLRQGSGIAIAASSDAETTPRVAPLSAGNVLLSYIRHDSSVGLGTDRIRTRVLSTGRVAGKCTSDDDCATLHCTDGVCCDSACNGACQTCAGATPGICTSVVSAVDPDTCSGNRSCNPSGACTKVLGQTCSDAGDCVSGFCADGVCCNSACTGGCNSCDLSAATAGTCTILPAGSTGQSPSCLPTVCDGTSASCPSGCSADSDCVRPYTCSASHACQLLGGAACKDDHTLESSDGTLKDCTPFACEGSICLATCHSIEECAAGFLCDDRGICVSAADPDLASGCSAGPNGQSPENRGLWFGASVATLFAFRTRRRRSPAVARR